MKTIEINLFAFNELNKQAKEKAIENFRNSETLHDIGQPYYDELNNSIEHLSKILDFTYDGKRVIINNVPDVADLRLHKWLINNWYNLIYSPKYIKCVDRIIKKENQPFELSYVGEKTFIYNKTILDKRIAGDDFIYGVQILEDVYLYLEKVPRGFNFYDIESAIFDKIKEVSDEIETFIYSEQFIIDFFKSNEIEFMSDGTQF